MPHSWFLLFLLVCYTYGCWFCFLPLCEDTKPFTVTNVQKYRESSESKSLQFLTALHGLSNSFRPEFCLNTQTHYLCFLTSEHTATVNHTDSYYFQSLPCVQFTYTRTWNVNTHTHARTSTHTHTQWLWPSSHFILHIITVCLALTPGLTDVITAYWLTHCCHYCWSRSKKLTVDANINLPLCMIRPYSKYCLEVLP